MNKKVNKGGGSKVALFFKKNVYYILLGLSLLAVGIIITLALVLGNKGPAIDPPPGETPPPASGGEVEMILPVSNGFTIGENFVTDNVVWYSTLGRYIVHNGVDFVTGADVDVVATLDGVVDDVTTDELFGTTVTINHGEGLQTIYKSLDKVTLKKGDSVTKGAVIGKTSDTMRINKELGKHLHFEVKVNGAYVNPNDYITIATDK